jgi:hypothetical protein
MDYTIKLTAYELAMLDAACRASGLPLISAIVKTANDLTLSDDPPLDDPLFHEELSPEDAKVIPSCTLLPEEPDSKDQPPTHNQ